MVSVFDTGISVNQSVLIYSWNEGFKQCLFSTAALCCIKSVCLSSLNPIGKQQGTYNILISLQPVGSAVQCQSAAQCNHANMSTKSCASEHSWIYQTIRSWLRSGQVRSVTGSLPTVHFYCIRVPLLLSHILWHNVVFRSPLLLLLTYLDLGPPVPFGALDGKCPPAYSISCGCFGLMQCLRCINHRWKSSAMLYGLVWVLGSTWWWSWAVSVGVGVERDLQSTHTAQSQWHGGDVWQSDGVLLLFTWVYRLICLILEMGKNYNSSLIHLTNLFFLLSLG